MTTETKIEAVEDKKAKVLAEMSYKFRDDSELSEVQLTDPDYRLKVIFGAKYDTPVCSKCHHCR